MADKRLTYGPFSISRSSGIITLSGAVEKSRVSYRLEVMATDDGSCCESSTSRSRRGTVVVLVKDVNNNAPRFTRCAQYAPTVMENDNVASAVIQVLYTHSRYRQPRLGLREGRGGAFPKRQPYQKLFANQDIYQAHSHSFPNGCICHPHQTRLGLWNNFA